MYTPEYLDGIREGRALLRSQPDIDPRDHIDNLNRTIALGFPASSPVGQMLRGERDFWRARL